MKITSSNALIHFVKSPIVIFNGVPVSEKRISEADDTEGYIIIAKTNEQGEIYADGDEIASERLTGIVEFRGVRRI